MTHRPGTGRLVGAAVLFISHATADTETAIRVKEWLAADGHHVFLDCESLMVGDVWRERLHDEIRLADAVVCLVTPAFNTSLWCAAEVGIAQSLGKKILPVRVVRNAAHDLIPGDIQYADLSGDSDRARTELLRAARNLGGIQRAGLRRVPWARHRRRREGVNNITADPGPGAQVTGRRPAHF